MYLTQSDLADRKPIWNALQMFWMDIRPIDELESAIVVCAESKYTITELEHIYWHEIYPVVSHNLTQPIPEWTGYDIEELTKLVTSTATKSKPIKFKFLHLHANHWWYKLARGIKKRRAQGS